MAAQETHWNMTWRERSLALEEKLKTANQRLARLEKLLGFRVRVNLPELTRSENIIVGVILTQKLAPHDLLAQMLYSRALTFRDKEKSLHVLLVRCRKKLAVYDIIIRNKNRVGWYMDLRSKARLRSLIRYGFIPNSPAPHDLGKPFVGH